MKINFMKHLKPKYNILRSKFLLQGVGGLIVLFVFSACTEVIDIQINSSDPQIITEGSVGLNEFAKVSLTKSIDLDDNNEFPMIENAVVTITEKNGESEVLTETKPGIYQSLSLKGKAGKTYALKVVSGNKEISSESTIPSKVAIDSLSVVNSIYPGGGPPVGPMPAYFYEITVGYTDPAAETNYYRTLLFVNGVPKSGNRVSNDKFNNGNRVISNLIMYDQKIKKGDTIGVELQCIDKNVFNYFDSMSNGRVGGNSSSPANPYTNLNGAVLGYFSAHTVERREFVVK